MYFYLGWQIHSPGKWVNSNVLNGYMPKRVNNFISFLFNLLQSLAESPSFSYHAILRIEIFPPFALYSKVNLFCTMSSYLDGCPSQIEKNKRVWLFLSFLFVVHILSQFLLSAKANINFLFQKWYFITHGIWVNSQQLEYFNRGSKLY